eukprot:1159429-Pelagomonas_calceolata.AAC.6
MKSLAEDPPAPSLDCSLLPAPLLLPARSRLLSKPASPLNALDIQLLPEEALSGGAGATVAGRRREMVRWMPDLMLLFGSNEVTQAARTRGWANQVSVYKACNVEGKDTFVMLTTPTDQQVLPEQEHSSNLSPPATAEAALDSLLASAMSSTSTTPTVVTLMGPHACTRSVYRFITRGLLEKGVLAYNSRETKCEAA